MTNIVFASMPTSTSSNSQPSPPVLLEQTTSTDDSTPIVGIVKEGERHRYGIIL